MHGDLVAAVAVVGGGLKSLFFFANFAEEVFPEVRSVLLLALPEKVGVDSVDLVCWEIGGEGTSLLHVALIGFGLTLARGLHGSVDDRIRGDLGRCYRAYAPSHHFPTELCARLRYACLATTRVLRERKSNTSQPTGAIAPQGTRFGGSVHFRSRTSRILADRFFIEKGFWMKSTPSSSTPRSAITSAV